MNEYDITILIERAIKNDIGESLQVIFARPYCRVSLVARKCDRGCQLFMEAVARYDVPLSPSDSASRKGLVRRLGSLGFQLVQVNGSKVYELKVSKNEVDGMLENLHLD